MAFGQADPFDGARKKIISKDFSGAKADLTKASLFGVLLTATVAAALPKVLWVKSGVSSMATPC